MADSLSNRREVSAPGLLSLMAESHSSGLHDPDAERDNRNLLERFRDDTEHDSGRTARTHVQRISAALRRYEAAHGVYPPLAEVFRDPSLLAAILLGDRSLKGEGRIRRSSVNATRNSFAAFAAWLPAAGRLSREEARSTLAEARKSSTIVRGLRRRTAAGLGSEPDTRHVPTQEDIGIVVDCLRGRCTPAASLTADAVALAYVTGMRIGAVFGLRREDVKRVPDGRVWLVTREKARSDRRMVELRGDRDGLLGEWEALPRGASLWTRDGYVLNERAARRELRMACEVSGLPCFTFHRLRHAFASDVAVYLGLRAVQLSGGWLAERVVETYVHRREDSR